MTDRDPNESDRLITTKPDQVCFDRFGTYPTAGEGATVVVTDTGLSLLRLEQWTLARKVLHYEGPLSNGSL